MVVLCWWLCSVRLAGLRGNYCEYQEQRASAGRCLRGSCTLCCCPSVVLRELLALWFPSLGWLMLLEPPAETFCRQAPRPSTGPHKLRECLPLIIFLRNRLKYALTGDEVKKICMQRFIKIDGKVRTDITYPAGFMGE